MILEIDLGNTRIKWRLRTESGRLAGGSLAEESLDDLARYFAQQGWLPRQVWVASVRPRSAGAGLMGQCRRLWQLTPGFAQTQARTGDLVNAYHDHRQMGVDRWLALLAARQAYSGPVLVVQAGTAITVDLLAPGGRHLGGYIGPGWQLMRQALAEQTAQVQLPAQAPGWGTDPGRSTEEAVKAALAAMMEGLIGRGRLALSQKAGEPRVVVGGGDGEGLSARLSDATYWPELVLDGLAPAYEGGALSFQG